jgi:hypothetical protein
MPLNSLLTPSWLGDANQLAIAKQIKVASGLPLQFVAATKTSAVEFEQTIYRTGRVASRLPANGVGGDTSNECLHDWFHAQVWLRFSRSKARLNAMHIEAQSSQSSQIRQRSAQRDRLTLFDENGIVIALGQAHFDSPCVSAVQNAIATHQWHALFIDWRTHWHRSLVPICFGHGLLQKLQNPFKAITAKAVVVSVTDPHDLDSIDQALSQQLDSLLQNKLPPLPVMGIPGWHPVNAAATFYTDTNVFRSAA